MSYVIKDGTGATQTVEADTVGGAIQPVSSPVDANGNHIASAPGVTNANAALAIQGVAGGVPAPVTFSSLQTVSITAAQLPTVAAQGSATAGQSGGLEMGAVSASAPSYANGQTSPFSLNTLGGLRVDFGQVGGAAVVTAGSAGVLGVGGPVSSGGSNSGGNPVKIGGAFNATQPSVTGGAVVDLQATIRGGLIVATGVDGFQSPTGDGATSISTVASANMLYNGSTWDRQRSAPGATGIAAVDAEGAKATYSATATSSGVGLGDIMTIQGSATKTIRVRKVILYNSVTSTGGIATYCLVRRSSASGGTSVTLTACKHDNNDAAPTATVLGFTATGTVGTNVANIAFQQSGVSNTTSVGLIVWDFVKNGGKALVLRGTSDFLALNFPAASGQSSVSHAYYVEWTEE